MSQAMKLKFSSYVHLLSINKMFQYHHTIVVLCSEEQVYIFRQYISALENVRMLLYNGYILPAYKHNL